MKSVIQIFTLSTIFMTMYGIVKIQFFEIIFRARNSVPVLFLFIFCMFIGRHFIHLFFFFMVIDSILCFMQ